MRSEASDIFVERVYPLMRDHHLTLKRAEMLARRLMLIELAKQHRPASVRHLFYLAVVNDVPGITKNDSGYNKVQRALVELRMNGRIEFDWIVDNTRWMRRPRTWNDIEECLNETARLYRRNIWQDSRQHLEVWAESDSVAGVVADVTYMWNVPLMVTRGYSSITFARNAVDTWNALGRPVTVYYIGDHDPAGLNIETKLHEYVDGWAEVPVEWSRVGVTWEQVEAYNLPGTKPKRPYGYPLAVEAEALPPGILRDLLTRAITSHIDIADLNRHETIEAEERLVIERLARWEVGE